MKIIFLDIDGVLNVIGQGHDEYGQTFHQHFMDNLKRIIDETGAKIVISSSWRSSGLQIMHEMWKHRGLAGEVIDVTPSLRLQKGGSIVFYNDKLNQQPTPRIRGYSIPRGCEIEYWMNNERDNLPEPITAYVILDDDTDMLLSQAKNFVQCSGNIDDEDCVDCGYGLTKRCADKAIQILNRQLPQGYIGKAPSYDITAKKKYEDYTDEEVLKMGEITLQEFEETYQKNGYNPKTHTFYNTTIINTDGLAFAQKMDALKSKDNNIDKTLLFKLKKTINQD